MTALIDLPSEILLPIIDNVSPLFIESFALTRKRIYALAEDRLRHHSALKAKYSKYDSDPYGLLRAIIIDPWIVLYATNVHIWKPFKRITNDLITPVKQELLHSRFQTLRGTEVWFHRPAPVSVGHLSLAVIPLLVTRLEHLRTLKLSMDEGLQLTELLTEMLHACHDPCSQISLLPRLTKVSLYASSNSTQSVALSILFMMLPSVRKLKISGLSCHRDFKPWLHEEYPRHLTGLKEISVKQSNIDSTYLVELMSRTKELERFTYHHTVFSRSCEPALFSPRLIVNTLLSRCGGTLTFLDLLFDAESVRTLWNGSSEQYLRQQGDYFIDSMKRFRSLRTIRLSVDMLVELSGGLVTGCPNRTVHRLVDILPICVETAMLAEGSTPWEQGFLTRVFEGLRSEKQSQVPRLRMITLEKFHDLEEIMSDHSKVACRMTGVKLAYTTERCDHPRCRRKLEEITWDDGTWIKELRGKCRWQD